MGKETDQAELYDLRQVKGLTLASSLSWHVSESNVQANGQV